MALFIAYAFQPHVSIAAQPATSIHLSPAGSDDGDGSNARPFATPQRARDAARDALRKGERVEVIVMPGTYELKEPLVLGPEDSGKEGAPVIWRAHNTKIRAIFSAGRKVKAEKTGAVITRDKQLYRIDLRAQGISEYGEMSGGFGRQNSTGLEVFASNIPMWPARYPNTGFIRIEEPLGATPVDIRGTKGTAEAVVRVKDARVAAWKDEKDPRAMGYWFWDWADGRQKITKVDPDTLTLTLAPPYDSSGYRAGQYFYGYNLLCELDQPGEWHLDRDAGVLTLIPPESATPEQISVSVLPHVVRMERASHIEFQGFTMELSREHVAVVKDCERVIFSDCIFRNGGKWAVHVDGGRNCTVKKSFAEGMGEGGIALHGGDRRTLTPGNHLVEGCWIRWYGRWARTYQPGIRLEGVGNRALRNRIHDAPHQGIAFQGNEHVMEYNAFENVCNETNDAGAIYAWNDWSGRGNSVRFNYFHNIIGNRGEGAHAVYLDDAYSSALIEGNIFYKVSKPILIGGGRDIQIVNNLFVECKEPIAIDARGLNWRAYGFDELKQKLEMWPYKTPPWSTRYPDLPNILQENPMAPKDIVVERNLSVACGRNKYLEPAAKYIHLRQNDFEAPQSILLPRRGPELRTSDVPEVDPASEIVRRIGFQPISTKEFSVQPVP